jgi:alpha-glucosidase
MFPRLWLAALVAGAAISTCAANAQPAPDPTWWKHAMIYEIYPRSFQDSNGDGVGDLNGIRSRLDYLQQLGVDTIWIAPMYPSPQVDFGYDISDYETVDPAYGTLADFDQLQAAANQHHIRIVLDMVLNHTSDKHEWFIESASSRTNPKAGWYVWNDGVAAKTPGVTAYQKRFEHDGMVPPNNWESTFGGSAWEWVPARKQFYYHKFYRQQPDLNWSNPEVEKAMFDTMRFWLDRGVAGFRLDAIPTLFEDPQLRNEPEKDGINAYGDPILSDIYTSNLAQVHETIRHMRAMVKGYPGDRVLIGETYLPNTAELQKWYGGAAQDELQLPMDLLLGFGTGTHYTADHFRKYIGEAATELAGAQPLFVFDNHDNVRSIDRFGDGIHNVAIAKGIAAVLLTTKATAMTYYGAEIGMPTTPPKRREEVKDPIGITGWPKEKGRDGERTPMQWTPGPQAGFSTNPHTWLPIPPDYKTVNVEVESANPDSLLNWYKHLIALRRDNASLRDGGFVMLGKDNPDVLSYLRTGVNGSGPVVVAINMTGRPQHISLDVSPAGFSGTSGDTLLSTEKTSPSATSLKDITLKPYAVWIATVR